MNSPEIISHPGVKGVTLICPRCKGEFKNCHPQAECFCGPCSKVLHRKIKLVRPLDIATVEKAVILWAFRTGRLQL